LAPPEQEIGTTERTRSAIKQWRNDIALYL
jgi:hypothetical protein